MFTTYTDMTEEQAHHTWNAIDKHLQGTTPHAVLGIEANALPGAIQRAYLAKHYTMIEQAKQSAAGKEALEQFTTAYNVLKKPEDGMIYQQWLNFKKHISHKAPVIEFPQEIAQGARDRLEATAQAVVKKGFSIHNPAVMLGAAVIAIGSAWVGINATKRISEQRDQGITTSSSDRALQALGLAGATGVLSGALLMWNASKGRG